MAPLSKNSISSGSLHGTRYDWLQLGREDSNLVSRFRAGRSAVELRPNNGTKGTRTLDLFLAEEALSRLSYGPKTLLAGLEPA